MNMAKYSRMKLALSCVVIFFAAASTSQAVENQPLAPADGAVIFAHYDSTYGLLRLPEELRFGCSGVLPAGVFMGTEVSEGPSGSRVTGEPISLGFVQGFAYVNRYYDDKTCGVGALYESDDSPIYLKAGQYFWQGCDDCSWAEPNGQRGPVASFTIKRDPSEVPTNKNTFLSRDLAQRVAKRQVVQRDSNAYAIRPNCARVARSAFVCSVRLRRAGKRGTFGTTVSVRIVMRGASTRVASHISAIRRTSF